MELQAEEMANEAAENQDETVIESIDPEEGTSRLARIIESVLFAAGTPMTIKRLSDVLGGKRGPSNKEIGAALAQLERDYAPGERGIQIVQVAGGYQLRTARENAEWVRALFRERPARLGKATMETLAIIAYRQPVTRIDIEAVRGVDADGALTGLLARRLIKIAGRKEAIGRPLLYATTPEFLEAFGLKDLSELPSLKELGPVIDEEGLQTALANADDAQAGEPQAELEASTGDLGLAVAETEAREDETRGRNDGDDAATATDGATDEADASEDEPRDVVAVDLAQTENVIGDPEDDDSGEISAASDETVSQVESCDEPSAAGSAHGEDDDEAEVASGQRTVTEDSGASGRSIAARSGSAD